MVNYRIVPGGTAPDGWVIEHTTEGGELIRLDVFDTKAEAQAALDRLLAAQRAKEV